ncbi:hypothetical protein [Methanobrevibacter sp.]|uniref:hypothetical protein n=1 Tax=Methanobrevibacter sp. TaxID=66852 RepID=UPI0038698855
MFNAELIPSEAGNLIYSTDNETILIVNSTGFKGFNGGVANIIVEFIEQMNMLQLLH